MQCQANSCQLAVMLACTMPGLEHSAHALCMHGPWSMHSPCIPWLFATTSTIADYFDVPAPLCSSLPESPDRPDPATRNVHMQRGDSARYAPVCFLSCDKRGGGGGCIGKGITGRGGIGGMKGLGAKPIGMPGIGAPATTQSTAFIVTNSQHGQCSTTKLRL